MRVRRGAIITVNRHRRANTEPDNGPTRGKKYFQGLSSKSYLLLFGHLIAFCHYSLFNIQDCIKLNVFTFYMLESVLFPCNFMLYDTAEVCLSSLVVMF